jgi:hypothetical protein
MHIHEVTFEVVNRESLVPDSQDEVAQPLQLTGEARGHGPEPRVGHHGHQ